VNPYVFIVGCPRSGTTLFQRVVDAHPELAIIDETLWILRLYRRSEGVTADGLVTARVIDDLLADRRFARLDLPIADVEGLLDGGRTSYTSFVSGIFDLYGRARGKRLVGDKSPGYVRKIPRLHQLWPAAKFVHLIRDGRDVALSALGWKTGDRIFSEFRGWPDDPWTTAALWWERSVRLGREAAGDLPPGRYHEVRYEALVADPEAESRTLCAFLDLPYDDAMVRFHEGRTQRAPGASAKRQWLPPTAGLRNWRTQMSPEAVERFEASAGGLLDELGYARGAPAPSPGRSEHAASARRAFGQDILSRSRRLPRAWA
jgi:Sulfotransferase family